MQYQEVAGGICAPKGFAAAGVHCGIRANHSEKYDLALIKADVRCAAAGVYTTNKVCGAPIKVDRAHLKDGYAQAIVVNSGNANTCAPNGIELAKEIKEIRSETRIIFCSAYTEYALDAFSVHAVGYLLKPITKAKIQETLDQIDMMLNRDPEPERQKLVVQTFGHFEAFFNDKPLPWERAKAKELLAFLVDQRGASATNAEIALTLWEDDSKVRSVQTIISSLRKTLRRVGMGDVLVRARNRTSINVKKIKCDLYDYLAGDSLAINVYQGEYMSNYSWAEFTNASLYAEIFLKEDL